MTVIVDCAALRRSAADLQACARALEAAASRIQAVQNGIRGLHSLEADCQLSRLTASVKAASADTRRLQSAAEGAAELYRSCEYKLAGIRVEEQSSASTLTWKVVSGFGTAGSLIGHMGSAAQAGVSDDPLGLAADILSLLGTGAKTASKMADGKLIDLWGKDPVSAIGFRKNLASKLDGYIYNNSYNTANMSPAAKAARNTGVTYAWGSVVITGISRLTSNIDEFGGDLFNPRLYAETVGETLVKAGSKILIGADVAALMGPTAPLWAASLGTLAATTALDGMAGGDFAEVASDFVLDGVEDLYAGLDAGCRFIGNTVRTTVSQISTGWKQITGWLGGT